MKLHLAELLLLALIQGEIVATYSFFKKEAGSNAVISNSLAIDEEIIDDTPEPLVAYVDNGKKKKIRKRQSGRQVDISDHIVKSMVLGHNFLLKLEDYFNMVTNNIKAQTPLSALSPDLPHIQKEIVDTHNKYRSKASPSARNMLKLVWNAEAAKTAKKWADKCIVGHSPSSERVITRFKCGENIFLFAEKVPWSTVIDSWYSECVDFKYGVGATSSAEIGHYTQLMWATSSCIGCAVAECSPGPYRYNYVCQYGPSGNKGGRSKPWKEGKPCEDCPSACENNLCTNPCPYQNFFGNCDNHQSSCEMDQTMKDSKCPASCQCTKGEIR